MAGYRKRYAGAFEIPGDSDRYLPARVWRRHIKFRENKNSERTGARARNTPLGSWREALACSHAVHGEYHVTVEIQSGVVHGDFPKRALRHVTEWLALHRNELLDAWDLIQAGRPASKIPPLE